jgi:hypothetical protein
MRTFGHSIRVGWLVMGFMASCGTESDTGSAAMALKWNIGQQTQGLVGDLGTIVDKIRITVTGEGMDPIISPLIDYTAKTATVTGIPVGSGRSFLVEALDSSGNVLYRGTANNITITTGEPADVLIDMWLAVSPFISGRVSGATAVGVSIALSGASSANVTTDTNGDYSFGALANGDYTVTPSKSGYIFSPANYSVTINGADVTARDFAATIPPVVSTPTFSPAAGTYNTDQNVTISCATNGATIYYTTDNSDPTTLSAVYSSPIPISGTGTTMTIKAMAVNNGMTNSAVATGTFIINYSTVAPPTFSVAAGTYDNPQSVTLSSNTSGATIRYTTNGPDPSETTGTLYTSAVNISQNTTLKAIAYKAGMLTSSVSSVVIDIRVAPPTLSPNPGTYNSDQLVSISAPGAVIHYTTDGNDPTTSSPVYSSAISVAGHNTTMTIKAIAVMSGFANSTITTGTYTISYLTVATPTLNPLGGTSNVDQSVTISCATSGATIHYTNDGSTPTTSSPVYSSAISITGPSTTITIKAIAVKNQMLNSAVASETYTITYLPVATPTFDVSAGTYDNPQNVTISSTTIGAEIHYTTDGTTPSKSHGTLYEGSAINITQNTTLSAIAYHTQMLDSNVSSVDIKIRVAPPTFDNGPGTYSVSVDVALTCTSCTTIYYTTNGDDPTTSSTPYSSAINITTDTTLKAMAVASGMENSNIVGGAYTITP